MGDSEAVVHFFILPLPTTHYGISTSPSRPTT